MRRQCARLDDLAADKWFWHARSLPTDTDKRAERALSVKNRGRFLAVTSRSAEAVVRGAQPSEVVADFGAGDGDDQLRFGASGVDVACERGQQ